MHHKLLVAAAGVMSVVAGVLLFNAQQELAPVVNGQNQQAPTEDVAGKTRAMSIEQYVSDNISAFSPVPEAVGGKFFVTAISAFNGAGTVAYEDGHSAYIADFTYSTNEHGAYSVDSFTIREE